MIISTHSARAPIRHPNNPGPPDPSEASLGERAIGAAMWGLGLMWIVPTMPAVTLLYRLLGPDRPDRLTRLQCRGQVLMTGSRWRTNVDPAVDPDTCYIFMQNHVNHFDYATMYPATPHFKQGINLESHFRYPIYGPFMKHRGTIAVRPGTPNQRARLRDDFQRELAAGHSILGFPEGTRSRDGRVAPFKHGLFEIARDLGLPIVPTAVTGMYDVMRKGSWIIRPGHTVTVHMDAPVPTQGVSDAESPALVARVRGAISGHVDRYWERAEREQRI